MSSTATRRRLDEAYRRSAELIPAWRSALARALRRWGPSDAQAFRDAARDVGFARLDDGIPTSRRSLDRLMSEALALYGRRRVRRHFHQRRAFMERPYSAPIPTWARGSFSG